MNENENNFEHKQCIVMIHFCFHLYECRRREA